MRNLRRNDLSPATTIYVAMLVFGIGIFALEPTWAGLGAVLLLVPGIAINVLLDRPARRRGVRA
jgi:hypothetical protein